MAIPWRMTASSSSTVICVAPSVLVTESPVCVKSASQISDTAMAYAQMAPREAVERAARPTLTGRYAWNPMPNAIEQPDVGTLRR